MEQSFTRIAAQILALPLGRVYTSLHNTEHQTPAVGSCVARQKCCCLLGYTEIRGWFLWWIAAKWGQRMDVSPGCCDLFSVSHFLCSCVAQKYVGIKWSNIGWESTFGKGPSTKHCWSKQAKNTLLPREIMAQRKGAAYCHPMYILILYEHVWVLMFLPHCPLRWLFAIPSLWSYTLGTRSRSRFLTKTKETFQGPCQLHIYFTEEVDTL